MPLNILQSSEECTKCVKGYAKKHSWKAGQQDSDGKKLGFDIECRGIPKKYVSSEIFGKLDGDIDPEVLLDPVKWAATMLDWHCLDPDGSIWAKKNPEEYMRFKAEDPEKLSKYHRPYQAVMLSCTAKYKVFRCGRQIGKSESLVVSMLFHMFTNNKFKIILVTPYQSQIELIFKRIEDLIRSSPYLSSSIKRSVKAPNYTLELYNGSQIKGFTAGSKSNGNAGSVRGQDANMLVFDEADYLNRQDLDSAMAIITNYPDATVWMSSTPTGRREKFFETCQDREWKEFYYPSHVNPNWTEKLDSLFKKQLTSLGYKHEVLADFGEQEEGIFQAQFVESSVREYKYTDIKPVAGFLYSIGVDWNSIKWGTCIYVTGFDPSNGKFFPVEHHVVKKDGWTQLTACEKIIELHRKWRPFAVYVDKGYGSTQIEVIHKFGYDAIRNPDKGPNHIDAKLVKTVIGYDFGSSVETRDLFTKEIIKKPAKGFLVENAVRRFENGEIVLPKEDIQLKKELLAYVIKNISQNGQVSYMSLDENIGDHNLDAFMLSLVAFTLQKTPFGKPVLEEKFYTTSVGPKKEDTDELTKEPVQQTNNSFVNMRKEYKPNANRTEIKQQTFVSKPMPNKLWSWPGFGHDAPRPTINKKGKGRASF